MQKKLDFYFQDDFVLNSEIPLKVCLSKPAQLFFQLISIYTYNTHAGSFKNRFHSCCCFQCGYIFGRTGIPMSFELIGLSFLLSEKFLYCIGLFAARERSVLSSPFSRWV